MFKKIEELGNLVQMDKSGIKDVRKGLCKCFPELDAYIDDLLPMKCKAYTMR